MIRKWKERMKPERSPTPAALEHLALWDLAVGECGLKQVDTSYKETKIKATIWLATMKQRSKATGSTAVSKAEEKER